MKRTPLTPLKHLKQRAFRRLLLTKRAVRTRRLPRSEPLKARSIWLKAPSFLAVPVIGFLLAAATWALIDRRALEPRDEPASVSKTIEKPPEKSVEVIKAVADLPTPVLPLATDAKGIGADLGKSVSLIELADRYESLRRRMPERFTALTPLIRFSNVPDDLDVTLITGPFVEGDAVGDFCRIVRLQFSGHCETTLYQGDALPVPSSK